MRHNELDQNSHLDFLDGVRGLAALYVVLHHAVLNLPWNPGPQGTHGLGSPLRAVLYATSFGHYAVDLFIVLSGYCLMIPTLRRGRTLGVGDFLRRRAWRILPPYYASMLLTLLLIGTVIGRQSGTHWDVSIPVTLRGIVTHLLLIHEWFPSTSAMINHAYWSVGVEWKIYFLFPLLSLGFWRMGPVKVLSWSIGLSFGAWLVLAQWNLLNPSPWGASVYYVGLFTMGMFAAWFADTPRSRDSAQIQRAFLLLTTAAVVVISIPAIQHTGAFPLQVRSLFVGAFALALLVALRSKSAPALVQRVFTSPLLRWLGKIGYSLYLVHAPILQVTYLMAVVPLGLQAGGAAVGIMLFVGTTLSVLTAYGFYRAVELPFHQVSRRRALSSRMAAA